MIIILCIFKCNLLINIDKLVKERDRERNKENTEKNVFDFEIKIVQTK